MKRYHYPIDGNPSTIDIFLVALHEIGHVIGLNHQGQPPTALMNPVYNEGIAGLQADDIAGAQSIYGSIPLPGDGTWIPLPGGGTDIAVGADGTAWLIGGNRVGPGADFGVYKWTGTN